MIPCPFCTELGLKVVETKHFEGYVFRRRRCSNNHTFWTKEIAISCEEKSKVVGRRLAGVRAEREIRNEYILASIEPVAVLAAQLGMHESSIYLIRKQHALAERKKGGDNEVGENPDTAN